MSVKTFLKEFFNTEDFKRSRKLAKVRAARIPEIKGRIAGFLRGDESLAGFADAVKRAVDDAVPIDGSSPVPVWGFGGPGTGQFVDALLGAAPEARATAELTRALGAIDTRDPSDRLRTFASFIARTARDAGLGPESHLHVGYATCFLSFCWHVLFDLEVPVFYGASHRGVKALLADSAIDDADYLSRDLAERFRAFLRVTRNLNEIIHKVNPQLNFWTVEAFLDWYASRHDALSGAGAGSGSFQASGEAQAQLQAAPTLAGDASGVGFQSMAGMAPLMEAQAPPASAPPPESELNVRHDTRPLQRAHVAPAAAPAPAAEEQVKTRKKGKTKGELPAAPAAVAEAPAGAANGDGLKQLAEETRFPEKLVRDLDALLGKRGAVALEGPTGAGKTFLARRFAGVFARSPVRVRYVQLHGAFRYEDFVEAPAPPGPNGEPRASPGVFKAFAQRAAQDPGNRYVVVLDELGQGDPMKLLGEVYSLLEYREEEAILPYSREPFAIPKNLYVLATVSTTAGARTLDDGALRRRFHFLHLEPSAEILKGYLGQNRPAYAWVADIFAELNRRLVKEVGPRAQVGQSLFMQPDLDDEELERIFQYDVRPVLETTVRDEAKLARFELGAIKKAVGAPETARA